MIRPYTLLALLLALAAAPTFAQGKPAFRYTRTITLEQPAPEEELVAVPLDSDVYAKVGHLLQDVRIVTGEGREVPFLLRQQTEARVTKPRTTWASQPPSLQELEDGGLEITVRLDKDDPAPTGLTLHTPLTNFRQRVRVFGRPAGGNEWQPLVDDALVFDYARYMDVSNRDVSLPASAAREFRIVIDDATAEQESQLLALTRQVRAAGNQERIESVTIDRRPFRIDRLSFYREVELETPGQPLTAEYPLLKTEIEHDAETKVSRITVQTQRQPLTSFRIVTGSRNFRREAVVEIPETRGMVTDWRTIGSGTISQVKFRDLHREEVEIVFPETRSEQFRIVIRNGDNPPLQIEEVLAKGHAYRLVFFAAPGTAYRLVYPALSSKPPQYDTAAVEAALQKGFAPQLVKLGGPTEDPHAEAGPRGPGVLNNPWLLGAIVVLLVILLGFGLYSASRRVDAA